MTKEEYDPLDPPTFNAEDEDDNDNDSYDPGEVNMQTAGDDDDEEDYDPSSFTFTENQETATQVHTTTTSLQPSQTTSRTPSAVPDPAEQPAKPRTVGGFIMDESDDEEEEHSTSNATPVLSQLNGNAGAQSGLGAAAVSHAQDISLGSEATPDTAAAINAPQTSDLTGSTADAASSSAYLHAPMPSVASNTPLPVSSSMPAPLTNGDALSIPAQPDAASNAVPEPLNGTASSQLPPPAAIVPQRLAHDRVGQLEDRIKDDPKADTDAWMSLIAYYKEKEQLDNVRKLYERFFAVFPLAVSISTCQDLALRQNLLRRRVKD
jgi:cleavage stimulation factor subunit 3